MSSASSASVSPTSMPVLLPSQTIAISSSSQVPSAARGWRPGRNVGQVEKPTQDVVEHAPRTARSLQTIDETLRFLTRSGVDVSFGLVTMCGGLALGDDLFGMRDVRRFDACLDRIPRLLHGLLFGREQELVLVEHGLLQTDGERAALPQLEQFEIGERFELDRHRDGVGVRQSNRRARSRSDELGVADDCDVLKMAAT